MSSSPRGDDAAALIDAHFLDGKRAWGELVASLLAQPPPTDTARPFYEGMRMLGPRTPELAVVALRLVLAGRRADDASVERLRAIVRRARSGPKAEEARREYVAEVEGSGDGE